MATSRSWTGIDALLLEEAPRLPWSSGSDKSIHAIEMLENFAYNDMESHVPTEFRGITDPDLKLDEHLRLYKGEGGFLFSTSPNKKFGAAMFMKGHHQVVAIIPMKFVKMGAAFKSLAQKTTDNLSALAEPTIPVQPPQASNVLDKTIRTLWSTLGASRATLRQLQMSDTALAGYFNSLADNVNSITNAVLPDVRRTIESGAFSLRDLMNLRHVSTTFPGQETACIYLRIYANQDRGDQPFADGTRANIDETVGFYIGKTTNMERRLQMYREALEDRSSRSNHVHINRRSSPANQHMIPLMVWTGDVSSHIVAMAEQTMIPLFRTYLTLLYRTDQQDVWTVLASKRAKFFSSVMTTTATATGWPRLRPKGCNFDSPLFSWGLSTDIIATGTAPGDPNSRTLISYRLKRNLLFKTDVDGSLSVYVALHAETTHPSGTSGRKWAFHTTSEYLIAQRPEYVYLVFEVMNDNKPHPRPWIGMPCASQFENFEQASSLGVHLEWYHNPTDSWCKVSCQRHLVGKPTDWVRNRDQDAFLRLYYDSMAIIQGLRGLEYTGTLNGHPMRVRFSNPVKTLETLHLSQRYRLQPRPTIKCSAPSRASWDYNFQLMFQRFSGPYTAVGPSTAPLANSGSMCIAPIDRTIGSRLGQERRCCDTCYVSAGTGTIVCEPEPGHPHGCCRLCAFYNRPCTFTPFSQLSILWGNRLPHVTLYRPLARFPNGPFRSLAYHRSMDPAEIAESWPVQVPLNEKFGVWIDDENAEEEEDAEEA